VGVAPTHGPAVRRLGERRLRRPSGGAPAGEPITG